MCNRPSRSLNSTVTALIRFSSVKYLIRCSLMFSAGIRFLRCSFASRFNSSSSSYDNARKFLSSLDNVSPFLRWIADAAGRFARPNRLSASTQPRQSKVLMGEIKHSYGQGCRFVLKEGVAGPLTLNQFAPNLDWVRPIL